MLVSLCNMYIASTGFLRIYGFHVLSTICQCLEMLIIVKGSHQIVSGKTPTGSAESIIWILVGVRQIKAEGAVGGRARPSHDRKPVGQAESAQITSHRTLALDQTHLVPPGRLLQAHLAEVCWGE